MFCGTSGQPHLEAPEEEENAVPAILSDYGFLGHDNGKCLPILVIKDKRTKRIAATFVEHKGDNVYARKFFQSFTESTGYLKIINKLRVTVNIQSFRLKRRRPKMHMWRQCRKRSQETTTRRMEKWRRPTRR